MKLAAIFIRDDTSYQYSFFSLTLVWVRTMKKTDTAAGDFCSWS
jgi:hypothetical protein